MENGGRPRWKEKRRDGWVITQGTKRGATHPQLPQAWECNGNVDRLKDEESNAPLKWKGVLALKMGNIAAKKALYKKKCVRGQLRRGGQGEHLGSVDRCQWSGPRRLKECSHQSKWHTLYGRYEAKKKKDIERACKKMIAKEKGDLMQKLAELEVEDANDDECVPSSLTPMQLM